MTRKEISKRYRENHREQINKHRRERYAKLKKESQKAIGTMCRICHTEQHIENHEIHGKEHPYSGLEQKKYLIKHPEDFIPLCKEHHQLISRFEKLTLEQKEIVKQILVTTIF